MPANENIGVEIGTQIVTQGSTIYERLPNQLTPGFPGPGDPRADNIKFNTDTRWVVTTPNTGDTLPEGSPFSYGQDISVKATWWKKVNIVIWCDGITGHDAQTDLLNYVHVTKANDEAGYYPGPTPNNRYAFFSDGENVKFSVTGTDSQKIIQIPNTDRYYRFIGWRPTPPELISSALDWCDHNVQHIHQNVEFDVNCLKEEYAVFLDNSQAKIIVTTNDNGTNGWNNNENVKYRITWYDSTFYVSRFDVDGSSEGYTIPDDKINFPFGLSVDRPDPHYLVGVDTMFELKGWYLGEFKGFDPEGFRTITHSDNWYEGDMLNNINAIQTPIIVTAVYMPSDNTYTITYHSGLPV